MIWYDMICKLSTTYRCWTAFMQRFIRCSYVRCISGVTWTCTTWPSFHLTDGNLSQYLAFTSFSCLTWQNSPKFVVTELNPDIPKIELFQSVVHLSVVHQFINWSHITSKENLLTYYSQIPKNKISVLILTASVWYSSSGACFNSTTPSRCLNATPARTS